MPVCVRSVVISVKSECLSSNLNTSDRPSARKFLQQLKGKMFLTKLFSFFSQISLIDDIFFLGKYLFFQSLRSLINNFVFFVSKINLVSIVQTF